MHLGEIIYNFRAKKDLTLKQFSERSDLSVAYLSQLENNRNPKTGRPTVPSPLTFLKVAKAMDMDVDQLFREVDQNQPVRVSNIPPEPTLSDDERILLECYRSMNTEGQERVLEYARIYASSSVYKKCNQAELVDPDAFEVNK